MKLNALWTRDENIRELKDHFALVAWQNGLAASTLRSSLSLSSRTTRMGPFDNCSIHPFMVTGNVHISVTYLHSISNIPKQAT